VSFLLELASKLSFLQSQEPEEFNDALLSFRLQASKQVYVQLLPDVLE
jgi:hypothetical protein